MVAVGSGGLGHIQIWSKAEIFQKGRMIDPTSEGLVTPPLGVEKMSPRLNFFDNIISCIT